MWVIEVLYYLVIYLFIASECASSEYYFSEQTFGARVTIHMFKMKRQASLVKCEKQCKSSTYKLPFLCQY